MVRDLVRPPRIFEGRAQIVVVGMLGPFPVAFVDVCGPGLQLVERLTEFLIDRHSWKLLPLDGGGIGPG